METAEIEVEIILDSVIQTTDNDTKSILFLVDQLGRNLTIVEVGCWVGHVTALLGFSARRSDSKVIAVDNFKGTGSLLEEYCTKMSPRALLAENIRRCHLENIVSVMESDSVQASKNFKDNSIDFLFLDADHRYSSVDKDIKAWYPKVKKSGIFSGHDLTGKIYDSAYIEKDVYNAVHHGVNKAVGEFFPTITMLLDTVWCAQR